jgi:molybdopterin synthase sulfur carrier subunit
MNVRVLYFAVVAELVGLDEEHLALDASVRTVGAFRAFVEAHKSVLAGRLGHVRIARNARFASDQELLAEGDELALIPPVAGG